MLDSTEALGRDVGVSPGPGACVSLSFHRFGPAAARAWAFAQMGLARASLPRVPDLADWKLCGSGADLGFIPIPNTAVWVILGTWPDMGTAQSRMAAHRPFTAWSAKAEEVWTVFLAPTSVRGSWAGRQPFTVSADPVPGPVAALTRATVRPSVAMQFWKRTPDLNRAILADPNVIFRAGIGEVPLMQQVTFSIWPDLAAMAAFARAPGSLHADAIRAVRDGGWFREELYARFRILGTQGTWEGADPLARTDIQGRTP